MSRRSKYSIHLIRFKISNKSDFGYSKMQVPVKNSGYWVCDGQKKITMYPNLGRKKGTWPKYIRVVGDLTRINWGHGLFLKDFFCPSTRISCTQNFGYSDLNTPKMYVICLKCIFFRILPLTIGHWFYLGIFKNKSY